MSEQTCEYTSLCEVLPVDEKNPTPLLRRWADVDKDGNLNKIDYDCENTVCIQRLGLRVWKGNKKKYIYNQDHKKNIGYFGICKWSSQPSKDNPEKEYTTSRFDKELKAIQFIELAEYRSIEQLVNALRTTGVDCQNIYSDYVILSCKRCRNDDKYWGEGVMCSRIDLQEQSGNLILKSGINKLPVYQVSNNDYIVLNENYKGKKLCFYRKTRIENENRLIVFDYYDIIKNIVADRLKNLRYTSIPDTEYWHYVKNYIMTINGRSIKNEIMKQYRVSDAEAEKALKNFVDTVDEHIELRDYDTKFLLGLFENHREFRQKFTDIAAEQWAQNNKAMLDKAQAELAEAKRNVEKARQEQQDIEKSVEKLRSEKKKLNDNITDLTARIGEYSASLGEHSVDVAVKNEAVIKDSLVPIISGIELSDPEPCDNWDVIVDLLSENLDAAGVGDIDLERNLSVLLCAAYLIGMPVILAGPNGGAIADAFSATLFASTAARVDCSYISSYQWQQAIVNKRDKIFLLRNALRSELLSNISDLMMHEHFFFVEVPYHEDLLLEPKSLFSYCLPILTNCFVEKMPSVSDFFGVVLSDNFVDYDSDKDKSCQKDCKKRLEQIPLSKFCASRLLSLLCKCKNLLDKDIDADFVFQFIVFPIMYITYNDREKLLEDIRGEEDVSKNIRRDLYEFLGEHYD